MESDEEVRANGSKVAVVVQQSDVSEKISCVKLNEQFEIL